MCGIAGIIEKGKNRDFSGQLKQMAGLLKHRGPDAEGFFTSQKDGVYLGHKRLSIIDLSQNANQPFYNEDGNLCLAANGEIYNFKELRKFLEQKGHRFTSNSDSEVIIHSYEEWGRECVKKLRGAFAFAIWDFKNKSLFLARDKLGIKPLYYIDGKDYFAFASEAKAFLALKGLWRPDINKESLELLLGFPFIPNDNTLLKGVSKVPPAHFLTIDQNGLNLKEYWKLNKNDRIADLSFGDAAQKLEALLLESVKLRLQSDVPVGILLSGGLDSSLIAALTKKVSERDVHTYTVGHNHPWDERKFARQVSEHIGSIHHSIELDPLEINDKLEELIWHFDDLSTLDAGILSNYLISKKVKEYGVKVILVGEGGDEICGGYSCFGLSQLPFKLLPPNLRNILYYYASNRLLFNKRFFKNFSYFNQKIKAFKEKDIFRQIASFELLCQLPNNYLMKMDKATMANSVEARVPFLDDKVVEFTYSLPRQYKLGGRWFNMGKSNEKFIMRKIAEKYLPKEIARRKKRGFSLPIPQVLKSNMAKIKDYLLSKESLALSLFSKKQIEKLFDFKTCLYSPIEKEKEALLWKLYLIEIWNNLYIKGKK